MSIKKLKSRYKKLKFLLNTNAQFWAIRAYFTLNRRHRRANKYNPIGKSYIAKKDKFKQQIKMLHFDFDWFSDNIPSWLRIIDHTGLKSKEHVNCLEIGSWQGMSAYFTLSELPLAHLTCIDTWERC